MARNILCVAEKPAIAKSVAQHLSGGRVNAVFRALLVDHESLLTRWIAQHHRQSLYKELRVRVRFWPAMGQLPCDYDERHRPS